MEIKEIFFHKSPSKRSLKNGIHSLLRRVMPERTLTSFTVYVTHVVIVSGSGMVEQA